MARAVLALGSNLGDREGFLTFAVSALSALPQTTVLKESNRRETQPVGVPEAFSGMLFLNAALLIETILPPEQLLEAADRYGKSPYGTHLYKVSENKVQY